MEKTRLFDRLPDEHRPPEPPKKDKKNKRTTSLVPGLLVLSVCIVAITALLVVFLFRMGLLNLPFGIEDTTAPLDTDYRFSDELLSRLPPVLDNGGESVSIEITTSDLRRIVAESESVTNYVQTMNVTYFANIRRSYTANVVTKNGRFCADLVDADQRILKRIVYDTNRIQLFDGATGLSKVFSLNDWFTLNQHENSEVLSVIYGFSPKSEMGLPSLKDVLTQLESGDLRSYKVELVREEDANYIKVSFVYEHTGVQDVYLMDLETGIILSVHSYLDGKEYYTVTTESLSFDLSEYPNDYFTIK